jgi:hypothetical protein
MSTKRPRALVLLVVALILTACTSSPVLSPTTTVTKPIPAVDISATPTGWVPVAFGDAQVSVPATWAVLTKGSCAGPEPFIELGVNDLNLLCSKPSRPTVQITPLGQVPRTYRQVKAEWLDGIPVWLGPKVGAYVTYFVPTLNVEVWVRGATGTRVIDTLAVSPRSVVLASGPAPPVPSSWRAVIFAPLKFLVPANWPVNRTRVTPGLESICQINGVAFLTTMVTLSTDALPYLVTTCLKYPSPRQPMNGVQVDVGTKTLSEWNLNIVFSKHCLKLHGLTACPATSPAYSILIFSVTVPGRSKPVLVSIGLAGNGMVARTILYSLKET